MTFGIATNVLALFVGTILSVINIIVLKGLDKLLISVTPSFGSKLDKS